MVFILSLLTEAEAEEEDAFVLLYLLSEQMYSDKEKFLKVSRLSELLLILSGGTQFSVE